ncbi:uncharacterized protein LOC111303034 [Durio zibethinus]|uniref:Uncharacterized protein LOC111303034 n=1 Tax=Durio zibethinus TaxID=66656 RepID=A0A6P5ZPE2_DURZI|nr:uncharacterized protein LOC111303034 [Durio zibethinus]
MEGLRNWVRSFSKDTKSVSPPLLHEISYNLGSGGRGPAGASSTLSSVDSSRVLVTRPPRQVVSLWTCSKLCAICFVAGIVVGYTFKRRVRSWAFRLLKRLKDD